MEERERGGQTDEARTTTRSTHARTRDVWQGGPGEYQNKNAVIGHARVPMGGGGCKPTVEIKAMAPGQNFEAGQTFMWLEGPTFFGGFLDLCCPTTFYLSSTQARVRCA